MTKMFFLCLTGLFILACAPQMGTRTTEGFNPLLADYTTPFGIPPFDQIRTEHYMPAFREGIRQARADIDAIVNNPDKPSFANTIEALEGAGSLLDRVENAFYLLNKVITDDAMQAVAREVAPLRTEFYDDVRLNAPLFQRVKAVYGQKEKLDPTVEQRTLLEETWKDFVRGGANLNEEDKATFRNINKELSLLSLQFGENVLAENNRFEMVLEEEDLVGLPENVGAAAADAAIERGHDGKWVFTIHRPSLYPFLTYSEHRDLREKLYTAYIMKGDHGDSLDNKEILAKMASLRIQRANLLGYPMHATYVLEENMAKTPERVYEFLDRLWKPALARAKGEAAEFQAMIDAEGGGFKLQPWDWWYYAEKVKQAKYALEDEQLRPYFALEKVRDGAFDTANKLWGLTFTQLTDIPVYHPDVQLFEVKEADGTHAGLLLLDFHSRASKRFGAWMNAFRKQSRRDGVMVTPIIYNVFNFPSPVDAQPALLSLENVETLFHEFGHALQGLLSNCTYESLSGTSVPRDYVELCSQIMENWATHPDVIRTYARHWETGEPIPEELLDRIRKASLFNQGFATVEYLAASYLDMDWHTLRDAELREPRAFENASLARIELMPEIESRYRSTYFQHIFAGGYSAGYYSYIWAEVLDADAFEAFTENGLFDQETAAAFREHILSTGGTEDPMVLYKRFRGREPRIEPILKRRGLD